MPTFRSVQLANLAMFPTPSAANATDIIPVIGDYTLLGTEVTGDVLEMCLLPGGYVPVDIIVDATAHGVAFTVNAGIMSGTPGSTAARTCGAEFMAAKALAGAGVHRLDVPGGARIVPTVADRGIGFALSTVTTPTVGARVRMTVMARPQAEGA